MKQDEMVFFRTCYVFTKYYHWCIRDVVNMFDGIIHHKRCWYLLRKWTRLGFYDYGVCLDLGWFNYYKIPERYEKLLLTSSVR